jgi:transposase
MAMGTRERRQRQEELWVATAALARPASHPFYDRLNRLLEECQFDGFVESLCKPFYAKTLGRPGLAPGMYFRMLMVGYFEGIDSERGMAWRAADSLGIRAFLRIALDETAPDHSTISRTRRLIDVETHRLVFVWLLEILAEHGLLRGRTIGIDATTLEANAALRSIVRRDTGEQYEDFLRRLAEESGIETPTRAQLAKLDKKRAKKGSNDDWTHPHDPDARIAKMKDGRTHLAHKAEHAVDMESGAVVAVTVQAADAGDTHTVHETLAEANEHIELVAEVLESEPDAPVAGVESPAELVTDKGYHSREQGSRDKNC